MDKLAKVCYYKSVNGGSMAKFNETISTFGPDVNKIFAGENVLQVNKEVSFEIEGAKNKKVSFETEGAKYTKKRPLEDKKSTIKDDGLGR